MYSSASELQLFGTMQKACDSGTFNATKSWRSAQDSQRRHPASAQIHFIANPSTALLILRVLSSSDEKTTTITSQDQNLCILSVGFTINARQPCVSGDPQVSCFAFASLARCFNALAHPPYHRTALILASCHVSALKLNADYVVMTCRRNTRCRRGTACDHWNSESTR